MTGVTRTRDIDGINTTLLILFTCIIIGLCNALAIEFIDPQE